MRCRAGSAPEVKNLPESWSNQEVTDAFKEFGELEGIKVARAGRAGERHPRYSKSTLAAA